MLCKECPFQEYEFNKTLEPGFGKKNQIMFIGSSPAITSNKSKGFSKFDIFFKQLLSKVDIGEKEFYFTNLCKSSIPIGMKLSQQQLVHCMNHLREEIYTVNPQIVVLLGKEVREAFDIRWPDSIQGKFITYNGARRLYLVYSIAHPAMLHYTPELEKQYLKKLEKIHKHYNPTLL